MGCRICASPRSGLHVDEAHCGGRLTSKAKRIMTLWVAAAFRGVAVVVAPTRKAGSPSTLTPGVALALCTSSSVQYPQLARYSFHLPGEQGHGTQGPDVSRQKVEVAEQSTRALWPFSA